MRFKIYEKSPILYSYAFFVATNKFTTRVNFLIAS